MTDKEFATLTAGVRVRYTSVVAKLKEAYGTRPHGPGAQQRRGMVTGQPHWWDGQAWAMVRWDDNVVTLANAGEIEIDGGEE